MSEEMNLYKRCKNIFKAHGVDMGGGGSGGEGPLVIRLEDTGDDAWSSKETFSEIKHALLSGRFIVVTFSMNGKEFACSGGSLMPFEADGYETIVFILGASGAIMCTGNENVTAWQVG